MKTWKQRTFSLIVFIGILAIMVTACNRGSPRTEGSAQQQTSTAVTYKVGDTGPAGGIIFYDKGYDSDGWRYLEAAPSQYDFLAEWGLDGEEMNATSEEIGAGKRNTELIVAALAINGESGKAAQYCYNLTAGGYDDWFLPSWEELSLMYDNLFMNNLGGFKESDYWSSTHTSGGFGSLNMAFYENSGVGFARIQNMWVRAVRAFGIGTQPQTTITKVRIITSGDSTYKPNEFYYREGDLPTQTAANIPSDIAEIIHKRIEAVENGDIAAFRSTLAPYEDNSDYNFQFRILATFFGDLFGINADTAIEVLANGDDV